MSRLPELALASVVMAAMAAVAYLNAGERVTVDLVFTVVHRVPVSAVIFGALFIGMLLMFLVGLRNDVRVRRILRDRFERDN